MKKSCNIGFVSTRFSGNDGVSLKFQKMDAGVVAFGLPGLFLWRRL